MKRKISKEMIWHICALLFMDTFLIVISMVGALWLRFDFHLSYIEPEYLKCVIDYLPVNLLTTSIIFQVCKLYISLWRFASIVELKDTLLATMLSTMVQYIGMTILGKHVPRSYHFLYLLLLTCLVVGTRFSYRFLRVWRHNLHHEIVSDHAMVNTMVVGAGAAGYMIVREMKNSKHLHQKVSCIIDDDPAKIGTLLQGIPIVGPKEQIPYFADKYDIEEIVIAIPTLTRPAQKELVEICQETGCKILILPGIYQLVREEVSVSQLRQVQIEDLLGREPVDLHMNEIMDYVAGKVILVTGGGGSIGSEICRQLALHDPKTLIIFDIYENNAYDIGNELKRKFPELDLHVLIGSVRDRTRVDQIFEQFHPELVFHAAAHKHVPLMEDSPNEAIKNNVNGTFIVAEAADRFHAQKMVLISTDKAVRPTNVMGASKRICELVIEAVSKNSKTEYAMVRFGNVLGSNGSVIPLFRKQIEAGGPVTVTHPEIIRYFMTIPEAVNLVLQCGARAKGGELFILDMGEPVKIYDLAVNMIRLSGLTPGVDIDIQFTGLRPGEKLYEELLISDDDLIRTSNERIFVAQQTEMPDPEELKIRIHKLIDHAFAGTYDIREEIKQLVPEYHVPEQNITGAEAAKEAAQKAADALNIGFTKAENGEADA